MPPTIFKSPYAPVDLPQTDLLTYLFSNPASVPPNHPIFVDATTSQTLTHADVIHLTEQLAYGLRTTLHVRPSDTVAFFSPNTIFYPVICYAILGCAATVSPVNAASTRTELAAQLKTSGAKLLIAHSSLLSVARQAVAGTDITLLQADGDSNNNSSSPNQQTQTISQLMYTTLPPTASSSSTTQTSFLSIPTSSLKSTTAIMCFSSGTTGAAKGVMSTHHNLTSQLVQWKRQIGPDWGGPNDTIVAFLPFSHIYALTGFVLGAMVFGTRVVVMGKFDLDTYLGLVGRWRVKMLVLVPPVVLAMAKSPLTEKHDLSSVRHIMSAAAPLGTELSRECEQRFKRRWGTDVRVQQAWGMTECSPMASSSTSEHTRKDGVGVITPNMEARIVDPDTLEDVTDRNASGEIWVRGPNVFKGYYGNEKSTRDCFVADEAGGDRWYRSGDVGVMTADGWLTIVDRIKEMIKYKGFQVIPSELEGKLLEHEEVEDACVVGIWTEQQATEVPAAFVVLKKKDESAIQRGEEIKKWLEARIAAHKRLRGGLWVVDAIAKSPSGKILRRLMKTQYDGKVKEYVEKQGRARL